MLRATSVKAAGTWPLVEACDSVILDFDARHRRRIAMHGQTGVAFLLDLPKAVALADGDGLVLEEGGIVAVVAASERLIEVRAGAGIDLVRIAWHLGNRHLPTQILGDCLRIREDHVILEMLTKLGARAELIEAPFDPEGGAYGHGSVQGHEHHD
ncbi:urease accessory protein UreE [Pelagibius litoralis]|uniref:Urease accessory protein UreE n=1 Tax=Pelagibius litoralis TaxID=374515 RepID=A0A967EXN3_9PROT|nr:urease accessory protein UreE [Pelagibius litoralis]NIA69318.1 urease accessory protein UreE [Pelagibius litoralis]